MTQALLPIPMGQSDFKTIRQKPFLYVDKSLFVRDLLDQVDGSLLITRPRRFGKSLNLSMLRYFFDAKNAHENRELFKGLAIEKDSDAMTHQGQYTVINLSFIAVKGNDFQTALKALSDTLASALRSFEADLKASSQSQSLIQPLLKLLEPEVDPLSIGAALAQIVEFCHVEYQRPVILLIDEYDVPLLSAYKNGYYADIVSLIQGFLVRGLKDNPYLHRAIMTGVSRVARESIFSDLNHVSVCSVLQRSYSDFFGFTEPEVQALLKQYHYDDQFEAVQAWYNGYQMGPHRIYNPWSILEFLRQDGEIGNYWRNTGGDELIRQLLSASNGDIRIQLETLLQGGTIEARVQESLVYSDMQSNPLAIWSLCVSAGYLTAVNSRLEGKRRLYELKIPNTEVATVYEDMIASWLGADQSSIILDRYRSFLEALTSGDLAHLDTIEKAVNDYLYSATSYWDLNQSSTERLYHVMVLGMVMGLQDSYIINSEGTGGAGRFDCMLLPKDKSRTGLIMEFKLSNAAKDMEKDAQEALNQIELKDYVQALEKHGIQRTISLGMAFHDREVRILGK